jgi:hypothetical protein
VEEQQSFLTVALPRFAGKTTTSNAVLALRPPETPAFLVAGEPHVMDQLKREHRGGYLVVAEFAPAPVPGYIWGEPVRRVFDAVHTGGYSLQTALHASSVEEGMLEVTRGNGISDDHASIFKLVLYIQRFGTDLSNFWRRITDLYEVDLVKNGRPVGRSLFRWRSEGDTFEKLEDPQQFALDREDLARRAGLIQELSGAGRTTVDDLSAALAGYRARYGPAS